ncbi:cyanophycinase [Thalassoglobus polymorphus]|uniref:Cyanophycinase n=1 Tax=Thalassoglobus polymorphus TaxID=2527994 RepID=A0A517QSJ6_9PLAN|nr:cyanophycinase [Thalassoglobus polymorphus]QDT34599.1 Cyanophycinase [Thalassoglobus polymorphus]
MDQFSRGRNSWIQKSQGLTITTIFLMSCTQLLAEDFPVPSLETLDHQGVNGSLVICGGGKLPDEIFETFRQLAGGEKARLVVIPTASARAETNSGESFISPWKERGFAHVDVLHTRDREVANSTEFVAPLRQATAVWIVGGQQSKLGKVYAGTKVEEELQAVLKRDGVIGGTSAGAAIQSRLMIASGNPVANLQRGLDLLPGAVIDQHFKARKRLPRLTGTLKQHPGHFGIGVDEGTALVVQGRAMKAIGASTVTICLAASKTRKAKQYELSTGEIADLTALRRAAIARASHQFPPDKLRTPTVKNGSLMIIGGGKMTPDLWKEFVELAGGADAKIVIVPAASSNRSPERRSEFKILRNLGVKHVVALHTSDRDEANKEEFLRPLKEATGVWFTGGRQWKIVDAYAGTETEKAFHEVLKRGGVIAGSSAGATIQGEYLVRGNPLGNRDMMAEGYERGFGYLPGSAIDQHFTQRDRHPDLEGVKKTFPQLLCIGIDESTAIVVQKSTARVLGKNDVYFFDAANDAEDQTTKTKVSPGEVYDLQTRQTVEDPSPSKE